jgi:hypothetical protein
LATVPDVEMKVGEVAPIVIVTKDSVVTVPVIVTVSAAVSAVVVACVLATENGQQSSLPLTHPTTPM